MSPRSTDPVVEEPPQCLFVLRLPFEAPEGTQGGGEGFQGHAGVCRGVLRAICVECILDVAEADIDMIFSHPLELEPNLCTD